MLKKNKILIFPFFLLLLFSCSSKTLPIDRLKQNLKDVDTYSIILEDMKEEGFVSTEYYHKYRVVTAGDGYVTPWLKVTEKYYRLNSGFLGMALANKKDGKINPNVSPPGYNYVGDSNYGRWRTDSSGNSFWEFYGKYAMFRSLMGGWYRPVYQHDYRSYRDYRDRNMVFYGSNGTRNMYGSNGSISKVNNPSFFERRRTRDTNFKKRFKSSFNKKVGRTKKGVFRGKAGRIGK